MLDAELYYKIIAQYMLPFVVEKYNLDCNLHQDNEKNILLVLKQFKCNFIVKQGLIY